MKRVIEKGNLAFNHMMNICDMCKRCAGFEEYDDNIYKCKYNTDNKGLGSGLVKNRLQNYKCKYFKRIQRQQTCKLQWKSYKTNRNGFYEQIKYQRGKFTISKAERL